MNAPLLKLIIRWELIEKKKKKSSKLEYNGKVEYNDIK